MPPAPSLLSELQRLVKDIHADLRERLEENPELDVELKAKAYVPIERGGRTAQAYEVWREDYLEQVAVAWVLACVFVRTMEDNDLIAEAHLSGLSTERRRRAEDAHERFFRDHPRASDRDYLLAVFRAVGAIPAAADLFAEGKTPLFALGPTGDGAARLLAFWREIDAETGELKRSFRVRDDDDEGALTGRPLDTRFLGDLYQDLSEAARKKYALLQTPVFVEEFILDRTLTPAIAEFGLEHVTLIDPTCGSGHFLLGAFARLFAEWQRREPGTEPTVLAGRALNAIAGVDVNPFAVAIARFRLIVAAMSACGITRLRDAPGWHPRVVFSDSLLHGDRFDERAFRQPWLPNEEPWSDPIYALEDPEGLRVVLGRQYHAVVGNPPYITVKDARLSDRYRKLWDTCHRQYSMAVPFTERFFNLARARDGARRAGFVGMITANSFMKREFGKKLIEQFLPRIDLTHVIDTSGAYIPGHGTPTVILFGRNRSPSGETVRAVLGIKGEPATPEQPLEGLVWRSILRSIDRTACQDEFTSSVDVARAFFERHPWSIGGGGAASLKETVESDDRSRLGDLIIDIGRSTHTGEDDVFYLEQSACRTRSLVPHVVPLVEGEGVRDYLIRYSLLTIFPYDCHTARPIEIASPSLIRHYWPYRTVLRNRKDFGQYIEERGLRWVDHSMFFPARFRTPFSIAFAFIATHNHFVLDRGGKVFNRSAPIIKLPAEATEEDHLGLLGLLNSSTACFWMKQVMQDKGNGGIAGGIGDEMWERRYEHSGTHLEKCPIAGQRPLALSRRLDRLGAKYESSCPESLAGRETLTDTLIQEARAEAKKFRAYMIALQEELDWQCYQLYGLLDEPLCYEGDDLPELALGQRAFEIVMARQMAAGELQTAWFARHGSTPITELPGHWPEAYRRLVERRIEVIETDKNIGLIERPEYKRRWNDEPWEDQQERALRGWLLDRLESSRYWPDPKAELPELTTTARLADRAATDPEFLQVARLYRGHEGFDLAALVAELVAAESVPFLPVLRYKPSGLVKRAVWERDWDLQRREDAGTYDPQADGVIPVPPRYASADFLSSDVWRLRGKLDVPKER
jgi:hypothetical protein